jgi:hypothetical protein
VPDHLEEVPPVPSSQVTTRCVSDSDPSEVECEVLAARVLVVPEGLLESLPRPCDAVNLRTVSQCQKSAGTRRRTEEKWARPVLPAAVPAEVALEVATVAVLRRRRRHRVHCVEVVHPVLLVNSERLEKSSTVSTMEMVEAQV